MELWQICLLYLAVVNVAAFAVCGWDKHLAQKQYWRIPEKTLLLFCALGGSPAFLLGMRCFRHKTRKPKFYIGVPVILLLQVVAVCLICTRIWIIQ